MAWRINGVSTEQQGGAGLPATDGAPNPALLGQQDGDPFWLSPDDLGIGGASPASREEPLFADGQGWTIYPAVSANADTSHAEFNSGNARMVLHTAGNMHDGDTAGLGPRIERAFAYEAGKRWRISARPLAATNVTGSPMAAIYVRGDALTSIILVVATAAGDVGGSGWRSEFGTMLNGAIAWDGTGSLDILISAEGVITFGAARSGTGLWGTCKSFALAFKPTFVGVIGAADGASAADIDIADFRIDCLG